MKKIIFVTEYEWFPKNGKYDDAIDVAIFQKENEIKFKKNHEAIEKLQNSVRSVENKLDFFITASSSDNTKFV